MMKRKLLFKDNKKGERERERGGEGERGREIHSDMKSWAYAIFIHQLVMFKFSNTTILTS